MRPAFTRTGERPAMLNRIGEARWWGRLLTCGGLSTRARRPCQQPPGRFPIGRRLPTYPTTGDGPWSPGLREQFLRRFWLRCSMQAEIGHSNGSSRRTWERFWGVHEGGRGTIGALALRAAGASRTYRRAFPAANGLSGAFGGIGIAGWQPLPADSMHRLPSRNPFSLLDCSSIPDYPGPFPGPFGPGKTGEDHTRVGCYEIDFKVSRRSHLSSDFRKA